MAALEVAYAELYTSDKKSTVDYFVSLLGFTIAAESPAHRRNGKESALLRQGAVQVIVTAGPGTRGFLDAHGDGIADIALACDDVAATLDAALAAGAAAAGPAAVAGFGAVRHTLVPAATAPGACLPADRSWIAAPATPGQRSGRIRLLDHVAVCVEAGALPDYADFYGDAFGFTRYSSEYVDYGDQAMDSIVVRNSSGRVTFTLVAPDPAKGSGQLNAFLDRNGGPGVQHLAFGVADIVTAVKELREHGMEFLSTPDAYYDMLATRFTGMRDEIPGLRDVGVLADRDEWGYLFQLFTRSPYERNTLFYELIERRGARGFGSANIRALYEAVDRADRLAAE